MGRSVSGDRLFDDAEDLCVCMDGFDWISLHEKSPCRQLLNDLAKITIPIAGSPYASAVRADMSIGDKEFQGPTPYYHLTGRLVLTQMKYHSQEI